MTLLIYGAKSTLWEAGARSALNPEIFFTSAGAESPSVEADSASVFSVPLPSSMVSFSAVLSEDALLYASDGLFPVVCVFSADFWLFDAAETFSVETASASSVLSLSAAST